VPPRWPPRKCQLLAMPCVTLSLTVFVLGGSDPTSRLRLGTLSFCRPLGNRGAHLGYNYHISCCHSWCHVRGVGETCKLGLLCPLLCLVRAQPFYLLSCDTVGVIKAGGHPRAPSHPLAQAIIPSLPPSLHLKKKEGRKEEKETREKG
jgi:hypothetical protein